MKCFSKNTRSQWSSITAYLLQNLNASVHNQKLHVSLTTGTDVGLAAVAPNGALTFVSDLYEGHCIEKIITEHCGDSVMGHYGFEIQDLLAARKIYQNIPSFVRSTISKTSTSV